MIKKIKMMLYGTPGVGKSVFALKFPKPFFITTDGNYEWLDEFGAKEEDHKQISSFYEFKQLLKTNDFANYDTIVIDLIEDLYKWCESEICKKNKIDHIGDLAYGKGYSIVRSEFFVEISKLLSLNKNIIFLSHESSQVVKDKRGIESTLYYPSKIIPEVLRDQIEGRLRYVLRAKFEDILDGDKIIQKRVLSLAKDSNEFSIIRGINMDLISDKINLDFNEFVNELKLNVITKQELNNSIQKPQVEVKEKREVESEKISLFDLKEDKEEKEQVSDIEKIVLNDLNKPNILNKLNEFIDETKDQLLKEGAQKFSKTNEKEKVNNNVDEQKTKENNDIINAIRAKLMASKGVK